MTAAMLAAGAVAPDRDPERVAAKLGRIGDRPLEGRIAVFDRRWERVLRGQAILGREDHRAAVSGEETADPVVGVEVADDPAAAVEVDEEGWLAGPDPARQVEARPQLARGGGQLQPLDSDRRDRRPRCYRRLKTRFCPELPGVATARGQRMVADQLSQSQQHPDVGDELLPVKPRRPPEEQPLDPRREPARGSQDAVLQARREAVDWGHRGCQARLSTRSQRPIPSPASRPARACRARRRP